MKLLGNAAVEPVSAPADAPTGDTDCGKIEYHHSESLDNRNDQWFQSVSVHTGSNMKHILKAATARLEKAAPTKTRARYLADLLVSKGKLKVKSIVRTDINECVIQLSAPLTQAQLDNLNKIPHSGSTYWPEDDGKKGYMVKLYSKPKVGDTSLDCNAN